MSDAVSVAAVPLVLGPVLGLVGFYDTALWRIWSAPREDFLAMVAAHHRGWITLNIGFALATVLTAAGLIALVDAIDATVAMRGVLFLAVAAYVVGGGLWCAVLATRSRTTPALAAWVADGTPTEPAETLLGAAMGGLFAGYSLATSAALIALGAALATGGVVAAPVAWIVAAVGALCVVWFLRAGDLIPAVLYLPTLLLGIALLSGWS